MVVSTLLLGLMVSRGAMGQVPVPLGEPPPVQPGEEPAPALPGAAGAPVPPAPAPAPPPVPPPAVQPFVVPPGYKLVPIDEPLSPDSSDDSLDAQLRSRELPYEQGDPIPEGYQLRDRPRRGLVIAGSVVTGVPWVFSVMAAVASDYENWSGFLLVPALGPWLMLATGGASDEPCASGGDSCSGGRSGLRSVLVLDGLIQTAGAAMFVAGLAIPRKRLVRTDVSVGFFSTPLGRDGYGLAAVGTF
jgi:hypothetical protein